MEYNFSASWCIKRIEKREKRNLKIVLVIFLCFAVLISIKTLFDFETMKEKENLLKIQIENYSKKTNKNIDKYKLKNTNTLKTLEYFIKKHAEILDYNAVEIDSFNINLKVPIKDKKDYVNKISMIESDKRCKVKQVSQPTNENNEDFFEIEVEVMQ